MSLILSVFPFVFFKCNTTESSNEFLCASNCNHFFFVIVLEFVVNRLIQNRQLTLSVHNECDECEYFAHQTTPLCFSVCRNIIIIIIAHNRLSLSVAIYVVVSFWFIFFFFCLCPSFCLDLLISRINGMDRLYLTSIIFIFHILLCVQCTYMVQLARSPKIQQINWLYLFWWSVLRSRRRFWTDSIAFVMKFKISNCAKSTTLDWKYWSYKPIFFSQTMKFSLIIGN